MIENIGVAERIDNLLCQDTGIPIYNVLIGRDVAVDGWALKEAIRRGSRGRRASIRCAPRSSIRSPARTSTRAAASGVPVINIDFTDRDRELALEMIPKGSARENDSFLQDAIPADGIAAVKSFVVDRVIEAGGKACPPTIVGVGVGGTSDLCMHLAKRAATRPLGSRCADPEGAKLEAELSEAVNGLGIGPQGLGGDGTALRRPRRDGGDPHHDESGRGQHPMPLGAPPASATFTPDGITVRVLIR